MTTQPRTTTARTRAKATARHALLLAVALACTLPALAQTPAHTDNAASATDAIDPRDRPAPRYLLQGPRGQAIRSEDFHDRFQLVAFGYMSCPDVCPGTMQEMKLILGSLGEQAKQLQPIFISVDPDRDTPAVLHEYVRTFDDRILGLTGNARLVRWAADNFKVEYKKVMEPGAAPGSYAMDHTAGMFLLGPDGQLLKKFGYSTPVANITETIQQWIAADARWRKDNRH